MLTREKLEKLSILVSEAEAIEAEITALNNTGKRTVTDSVKGSEAQYPYTLRRYTLAGRENTGITETTKKIQAKRRKLEVLRQKIDAEYDSLTKEIEQVPDLLVRRIMIYKYREGLTWDQVAAQIQGNNSVSAVRMAVSRYLTKQKEGCAHCAAKM